MLALRVLSSAEESILPAPEGPVAIGSCEVCAGWPLLEVGGAGAVDTLPEELVKVWIGCAGSFWRNGFGTCNVSRSVSTK